jgi:CYTH domain-containing protein
MGMEVERKFLLAERPDGLEGHPAQRLEQGYLAIDPAGAEVRVRRKDDKTLITVKSGIGLVRAEEEFGVDRALFERLWPLTAGRQVVKTRYLVPVGEGLTAEVDDYEGALAGLLTAEVEFADEASAHAFRAPEWMGEDVTGNPRYANRTLAVEGIPS